MLGSFVGLVIMAQSKPIYETEETEPQMNKQPSYIAGIFFALLAMVFLAFNIVTSRFLKQVHFSVIQLHYSFWGVIMALAFFPFEKPSDRKLF
jgi:drug/metabolite transporter (DMT)-like permease